MKKELESEVQKWLIQSLKTRYPYAWVQKIQQGMYSSAGVPDVLCCFKGKFYAIEVKTSKGKLSKLQELCIKDIETAEGKVFVIYGKDKEQLNRIIAEIDGEDR